MINILSTKKLAIEQLRLFDKYFHVVHEDFIEIRYNRLPRSLIKETRKNVVITSKHTVASLLINFTPEELDFDTIYCVGRKTKVAIEQKIGKVAHVEKNAKKLATYLVKNLKDKNVTFFCGNLRREELPSILTQNGFELEEIETYRTQLRSVNVSTDADGILFFSPSAVAGYIKNCDNFKAVAFCIGNSTAREAEQHFEEVVVAKMPSVEHVIEMVNQYGFKHINPGN